MSWADLQEAEGEELREPALTLLEEVAEASSGGSVFGAVEEPVEVRRTLMNMNHRGALSASMVGGLVRDTRGRIIQKSQFQL